MFIDIAALLVGTICLIIAIAGEIRSARLRHAMAIQLAQIKESNSSILKRVYEETEDHGRLVAQVQILATNQCREITGLYRVTKLPYINVWKFP